MQEPGVDVYFAARTMIDAGLAADDSAFTPGVAIWTAATADDLHARFVLSPLVGGQSFLDKFRQQLAGAPDATVQLAAELLYLHLLAPDEDMGGAAKRAVLAGTLGMLSAPVVVPPQLDAALDSGFATVGQYYLARRDMQLAWLVRLLRHWKALPASRRGEALADPWQFRDVADEIPVESAFAQRNALLHLAFPDVFESIVSRRHKELILAAFAEDLPEHTGDQDRDLFALRHKLEAAGGGRISYYEAPLLARWRPERSERRGTAVRGWLVRGANVHGQDLVPEWLRDGYCSIAYSDMPEIPSGLSRAELDAIVAAARPDSSVRQRAIHVGVLDRFLTQVRPGDLIATVSGPKLFVGTIRGDATWYPDAADTSGRRRAVEWANPSPALRRDQLPDAARDKLAGQMTVSELGPHTTDYAALAGLDDPLARPDASTAAVAPTDDAIELPEPTQTLADTLLVDLPWLRETIELLKEKKQLVFYGPPGTGKTYLAQEIARWLAEQTGGSYRLVQFHPSYAYEDFFEGFRPQAGTHPGTISFALEPGPFKLLVNDATENPAGAYVLLIDEINRANLAKVFGELYFLLEYRDRAVSLQYSPGEEFRLPGNVYVIGTMNTADRSIALVDVAMRRRFAWQGLFPGEPPVADMLRAWLHRHHLPADRAELLDVLNERIGDRDQMIGPSYLMTPTVGTEHGLARIWKHAILPLLEERHVDDPLDIAATYGLAALRQQPTTTHVQSTELAEIDAALIEEHGEQPG